VKKITATELARNLRQVLDKLVIDHEEILIERNSKEIARLVPGPGQQTALEAFGDLYRTLSDEAAKTWESDMRRFNFKDTHLSESMIDPWAS